MDNRLNRFPDDFQQRIAIAWASACLARLDARNPDASVEERSQVFKDALEGGLSLALELTHGR